MQRRYYNLILTMGLFLTTCSAIADELHIAVAANFTHPIKQLQPLFEAQTSHQLRMSFGSTGQLYTQIKHGAPYQVFLAADMQRPQLLIKEGLADERSLLVYAMGKLVLWSTKTDLIDADLNILKGADFQYLAIANPKTSPYGLAAKQFLQHKGQWSRLQNGKIVRGKSIAQTYQFVATDNAELGFIAYSQYLATPEKNKGSYAQVETNLYDPIKQGAVLLTKAKEYPAALSFINFIKSDEAIAIIKSFGYKMNETIKSAAMNF